MNDVALNIQNTLALKRMASLGEVNVLTTTVFDRPLFSQDVIILFENLDRGR